MGSARRTTAYGQLLLCAALLLGIFTMHTLGHPAEHASPMTAAMDHSAPPGATAEHKHPSTAGAAHSPTAARHPHHPLPDMAPGSVCLAVLGVWGLALLGVGTLWARGRATDAAALVRGLIPRPRWPDPPPPYGSSVAALSVLRQ